MTWLSKVKQFLVTDKFNLEMKIWQKWISKRNRLTQAGHLLYSPSCTVALASWRGSLLPLSPLDHPSTQQLGWSFQKGNWVTTLLCLKPIMAFPGIKKKKKNPNSLSCCSKPKLHSMSLWEDKLGKGILSCGLTAATQANSLATWASVQCTTSATVLGCPAWGSLGTGPFSSSNCFSLYVTYHI